MTEEHPDWDPRYIDDKWPNPIRADNPTNLNWENFGYSKLNKNIRLLSMWVFTLCILAGSFAAVLQLTIYQND